MNLIDLLLLLIVVSSIVTGWHRGFILGILDLSRWIGSLLIGLRFYPDMATLIEKLTGWNEVWILPASFFIVTLISSILLHYIGAFVLRNISPSVHSRKLNKAFGLLSGLLSGVITVAIVAVLLLVFPLPDTLGAAVQNSKLANRFASYTDLVETALNPVFEKAAQGPLNTLTIETGTKQSIELPYKVQHPVPQPELEVKMLELLNNERISKGLEPLEPDTALRTVARKHSTDMFRRGYFSHYSPEGFSVGDRIRSEGIRFLAAGENLALAPTLTIAHEGLMNSPGHRANILQKRFRRVGIGVMKGGPGRLMITQNFRN